MREWLKGNLRHLGNWINAERVAYILGGLAVVTFAVGYATRLDLLRWTGSVNLFIEDFYANLSTDFATIALTVLVIDKLNERRIREEQKTALILQMGSPVNDLAREASRQMRIKGWLQDGTLRSAKLNEADLRGVNLRDADLQYINLTNANLESVWLARAKLGGSFLGRAKLQRAHLTSAHLRGAYMFMADLEDADLAGADLRGANLTEANLAGASFQGFFSGNDVNSIQRLDALFDQTMILPDGSFWTPGTDLSRFTDSSRSDFWRSKEPSSPAYSASSI